MLRRPRFRSHLLPYIFCIGLGAFIASHTAPWGGDQPVAAADIQISRDQFARYIDEWSEPDGFFDTDNFISNETSYLHVVNQLRSTPPGGVYIGVGPDQNFSYVAHTRPALAIIIDIRRQNMLQHLLYKALFDLSSSRAEFLARLFSREPLRAPAGAGLPDLLRAVRSAATTDARYKANLLSVQDRLLKGYGLKLTADDLAKIDYVYSTFHRDHLDLRFSSFGRQNALRYPTFEDLLLETDRSGRVLQNYLAAEETFLWLKKFQAQNRLIPVVGDFAGPHAFKAAAGFLRRHGQRVTVFYTSNVEFYLFRGSAWARYIENVRSLPFSDGAVFIRAYFENSGLPHPMNVAGHRSTTLVHEVDDFLADEAAGRNRSYQNVVNR